MRTLLTIGLLLTLCLTASADPPPITFGGLFNLTGRQSTLDVPASQGAQLAIEQANLAGRTLDREVNLILMDGESDLAGVVQKTRDLLASHPRLCALMGFSDTDFVLATAPVAAKQKMPFVTSGATSPRLPKEVPVYLFMAAFGDNVQAAAAAEFASADLKAKTAFVFYDESTEYTRLLQQYFTTRFQELGGQVIGSQSFTPGNMEPVSLKAAKADLLFLSAGPQEALDGVRLLRSLGLDQPIMGGDGFDSNVWAQAKKTKNVYFTSHVYLGENNPRPAVIKFRQDYQAKFPDTPPDAFAALGYDTVNLLLAAIRQSNSAEPEKIREGLSQIKDFEGVTGTISFGEGHRLPSKSVSVIEIVEGQPRLVRELLPGSVPAP